VNKSLPVVASVLIVSFLLAGCGALPGQATPTPTRDPDAPVYNIELRSFIINPDRIFLKVGQQVTFNVTNTGIVDHELMIGRNPLRDESGELGDGFEDDFFAFTKPEVTGDAEVMGMGDAAMGDTTAEPGMDMESAGTPEGQMAMGTEAPSDEMGMGTETPQGEMAMGGEDMAGMEGMENGFMVMLEPEKKATITFTVTPEMAGTWTMGCFEVSAGHNHFDEGMAGLLIVRAAD